MPATRLPEFDNSIGWNHPHCEGDNHQNPWSHRQRRKSFQTEGRL